MSANEVSGSAPASQASVQAEMKVEVIVISVSDIDRRAPGARSDSARASPRQRPASKAYPHDYCGRPVL